MGFSVQLFCLSFLLVGSQGFSLSQFVETLAEPQATIGELLEGPVCDFLNNSIPLLPDYIQVFGDQAIVYNLTAVAGLLLNNTDLMSGQLSVSNVALANLNKIDLGVCSLTTATSSAPLNFELSFDIPLGLEAKYTVDGVVSSTSGAPVPVHGQGIFTVYLDIQGALVTSIKFSPMFHPLVMLSSNYALDVPTVGLNLEGVEGDPEFVEEMERVFEGHILHGLLNLNTNLHDNINVLIPPVINEYIFNGMTALELIEIIFAAAGGQQTTTSTPLNL